MASISLTITQNSQNVANNTSNVTIELSLYSTNKDWNNWTSGSNAPVGTITIDGAKHNFTHTFDLRNKTTEVIYSTTLNIAHASDGTKTLNVSATFDGKTPYTSSLSTSASKTLTQINRGSASLRVVLTEDSQSAINNTSTVTARVFLDTTNYVSAEISDAAGTLTLNGTTTNFTYTKSVGANGSYLVYTKTQTVSHNEDGTKSVSASAKLNTRTHLGNLTAPTVTKALTKINRGSASLRVVIAQDSQSIANNTSTITVAVFMDTTANVSATVSGSGKIIIDGTSYTFTKSNMSVGQNKTYTLYSKTVTVTHNASGSKTVSASGTFSTNSYLGSLTAPTVTRALTQIPRPTQPTTNKSTYAFGENIVISMPRNVSSVTHTVQAGGGNKTWTNIATGQGTSYTWAFPKSWAQYLTKSSHKLRIRVITYSGSTQVGIKEVTPQLTITATSDMAPTVTITHQDTNTAVYNKFSGYVIGKSKIKMNVATSLYQGTTLVSGTATLGTLSASITSTSFSLTAKNNVNSASTSLKATVKDARGLSKTVTATASAYEYYLPAITTFTVSRCNQDGSANDQGAYGKVSYNVKVAPVNNKNDRSLTLSYKKQTSSSWTTQTISMTAYTKNGTFVFAADTESVYDVRLVVGDYFTTTTKTIALSSAFVLMDFHKNGKGVGIGRVAEHNQFGVALPSYFTRDIVTEEDVTSGNGNKLSQAFVYHGRLAANTGLNTVITPGRYHFATADNITDTPDGVTWGLLEVLRNSDTGGIIIQRITVNNRVYIRQTTDLSVTWSAWATFSSDAQRNQWTTYTETYQGLTVTLKVNQAMPTLVRLKISGTTTGVISSASDYVTIANFSDVSMPTGVLGYVILGALGYGQIRMSGGDIDIGYTRRFSDGTVEDIPTGRGVWVDQAFVLG